MTETSKIQLHVDSDLKDRIKTQASLEKKSIKQLIVEVMEEYLKNKGDE